MRIAIYVRVSDDAQKEQHTIESQLAELRQFAKEQQWSLDEQHIYIDDGHSGFRFDRPALDRLRDAVRDGLIDLLLILDPDRLARNFAYQYLLLEEFERRGIEVRFIKQPPPDSPEQRLLVQIQGVIAEYERARIMERTRRGRLFWARQGRPVSSHVPYGYRYVQRNGNQPPYIEVDSAEAEIVREIFHRYVDHQWTSLQIALHLSAKGVPTPTRRNADWDPSSVIVILRCEAYLGSWFQNRYQTQYEPATGRPHTVQRPREEWIPMSVTPLIESQLLAKAQQILDKRNQDPTCGPRPLRNPDSHLLRHLVVCGSCGYKMTALNSNGGRGYRYYWCRGPDPRRIRKERVFCPYPTLDAQQLDEMVWSDAVSLLSDPDLLLAAWKEQSGNGALLNADPMEEEKRQLKKQHSDAQQQRRRLLIAYEQEAIELEELVSRRNVLDEKIQEVQRRLQILERQQQASVGLYNIGEKVEAVCRELATGVEEMNMPQKMKLCSQLIERVVVDDHSAEIHYRFPVSTNCNTRGERGCPLM